MVGVDQSAPPQMVLVVQLSPAACRRGKLDETLARLAAGTHAPAPGKWRIVRSLEMPKFGIMRQFQLVLEPVDAAARRRAAEGP